MEGQDMTSFTGSGQWLEKRYQLTTPFSPSSPYPGVEVWNAVDSLLGTAVRIIALDPESPHAADAIDAARRSALIDDPHIVRILSVGQSFVVTELPLGTPVSAYLAQGTFDPADAHAIVGETAAALNAARARGVRHLQVSPDVVRVGSDGEVYVDGLGVDAALAGIHTDSLLGSEADRQEARGLAVLLARLLTGNDDRDDDALLASVAERTDVNDRIANLCRREAEGSGALSPSDVVRELAPWAAADTTRFPVLPAPAVAPAPAAEALPDTSATALSVDPLEAPEPDVHVTPQWESLETFAGENPESITPVPVETPAGQEPKRLSMAEKREEKRLERAAARPVPTIPEEELVGEVVAERRYNPAKVVILGAVLSLVLLTGWAFATLLRPTSVPAAVASASASASESSTAQASAGSSAAASATPSTDLSSLPAPAVASVALANPYASGLNYGDPAQQDNPLMLPYLIDGNASTAWKTWPYTTSVYGGFKSGVGLAVKLNGESKVTSVTLTSPLIGGKVQLRDTTADAPDGGTVMAEASFTGSTVTLTASQPYATDTVVLWFPELAKAEGANYRIHINELTVQ